MNPAERRRQLIDLDRKIREALLGEPETRYDLLDLQERVRDEIRSLNLDQEVYADA